VYFPNQPALPHGAFQCVTLQLLNLELLTVSQLVEEFLNRLRSDFANLHELHV